MENHHFSWENSLFLWPFSIAMLNYQRVYSHLQMVCLNCPNSVDRHLRQYEGLIFRALSCNIHQIWMHPSKLFTKNMTFISFNAQIWSICSLTRLVKPPVLLFGFQKMTSSQVRATRPWKRTVSKAGVPKISKRPRDFLCAPGHLEKFHADFVGVLVMPNIWTQQLAILNQMILSIVLIVSISVDPQFPMSLSDFKCQIMCLPGGPISAVCKEAAGFRLKFHLRRDFLNNSHQLKHFRPNF